MTDSTTETPTDISETATTGPAVAATDAVPDAAFDPARRATELAILDALRAVVDPEIGMNVVELALIKQIILGSDSTEIKMILTTPFTSSTSAVPGTLPAEQQVGAPAIQGYARTQQAFLTQAFVWMFVGLGV